MKFIVLFLVLISAIDSHAEAFSCRPQGWNSRIRLKNKSLTIVNESCIATQSSRYGQICHLGKMTLMVSVDQKYPSIIVLDNGLVLKMSCDLPEIQNEQEEQQPREQQQGQQQESGDGPGHGGNTIGGKG